MGSTLATLIAAGTIGAMPAPTTRAWFVWKDQVLAHRIAYCSDVERTYVYVSDSEGSDAGDGLTAATPKKTLAAAVALLAPNVQILLKRGDWWHKQTITLDEDFAGVGAYGVGNPPLMIGAERIAPGSSWTEAATGRWTASVAGVASVDMVFQGDPDSDGFVDEARDRPYMRVASTAAVEATAGTFYWASDVLHLHPFDDDDPNDLNVWHRTRGASPEQCGVLVNEADGCVVEDVDVLGYGSDVGDQLYNIKVQTTGTKANLVRGCRAYFNCGHHVIGSFASTSGGITVWDGLEIGYCCHDTSPGNSTIGVAYAVDGEHEVYIRGMLVDGGQLDHSSSGSGTNATVNCSPFYSHGAGTPASPIGIMLVDGFTARARAGNAMASGVSVHQNFAAVPTNQDDWDEYKVFIADEEVDGQDADWTIGFAWNAEFMLRINPYYHDLSLMEVAANGGSILGPVRGAMFNLRFHGVAKNEDAEYFAVMYGSSATHPSKAVMVNAHLRFDWVGDHTNQSTGIAKLIRTGVTGHLMKWYGSILSIFCTSADEATWTTYGRNIVGAAVNGTPAISGADGTSGYSDCAFCFCVPTGASGFASSQNPLDLTDSLGSGTPDYPIPSMTQRPAFDHPLVGHLANMPASIDLEYDAFKNTRRYATAGPIEAASPVDGRRERVRTAERTR